MLDLFGGVVSLLFTLLSTTTETTHPGEHILSQILWRIYAPKHQMQSGLLLDVVVVQGTAILELLAGKDEALLVGWDAMIGMSK